MRIAFAGTPEFAATALQALINAGHELALVLTQPDRPAGRGLKLQPSAVKALALRHGLAVEQPRGLRLDGRFADDAARAQAALEAARPEAVVVAAYGLILPRWVLEFAQAAGGPGCLNIHASLLPRWRGAAPIQRAIEAGDACTGTTIMRMDEGLDTGDILLAESLPIGADDTAASLHDRLAAQGAALIVEALARAGRGGLEARSQPAGGVTYAHKLDKAEARLDWRQQARLLERRVRAFDPFPGTAFKLEGTPIKCWSASVVEGDGAPGTVLRLDQGCPVVACGEGALRLDLLQRSGGRRGPAPQVLQGERLVPGQTLAGAPD